MMNMLGFIQLLIIIILCWCLMFSIVDRICRCIESRASLESGYKNFEKFMDKYANTTDSNE